VQRLVTSPQGRNGEQRDGTILVTDDHVTFAEAGASVVDDVPGLHAFALPVAQARRQDRLLTPLDRTPAEAAGLKVLTGENR
jgi:hypothetical protein